MISLAFFDDWIHILDEEEEAWKIHMQVQMDGNNYGAVSSPVDDAHVTNNCRQNFRHRILHCASTTHTPINIHISSPYFPHKRVNMAMYGLLGLHQCSLLTSLRYILRRAAFRALASSPQLARSQSTLSSSSLKQITSFPKTSACSIPFRRSYATEQRDLEEDAKEKVDSATESIKDTAEHANERAQSTIESVAQRATEAAESVKSSVSAGIDAITPEGFGSRGGDRMSRVGRDDSRGSLGPNAAPSTTLYIGNLYFEVTEAGLRKEFGKYGNVSSVKIVYDGRGLSKGYVITSQTH